ncbi:MAG: nucleotidyltransferase domain-containing protein [Candidatus Aenigmarchaeota archaeon]|nr:nucleotidyltransferase domain-containing protein [Candidatus Aenigmarchaeota archaeon]
MEQKSYINENEKMVLIEQLTKTEMHVRRLSKVTNINHMTVSRKLKELSYENVVDFREEGKNKVYFLKETNETRSYVLMLENYKLMRTLKKYPNLRKIVETIQKDKRAGMSIIFGSYAKGTVKKDSDIDIYMESADRKLKSDLEMTDSRVSIKMGRYDPGNPLMQEIEKNHVIIKGTEEFYEKNRIFK